MNLRVFVSGPESAGKSTLTRELAGYFHGIQVDEYARGYIEGLKRPYGYRDVVHIARQQLMQIESYRDAGLVFYDTGLIITKVWFEVVFKRVPGWFVEKIPDYGRGIYLLCEPDLPWVEDPVRENPHRRQELFERYRSEMEHYGFRYYLVNGSGSERLEKAVLSLESHIKKPF